MLPALRAWSDGQKRSELTQSALVVSNWIRQDFLRSSPDSAQADDKGMLTLDCAIKKRESHESEFSEQVIYWREGRNIRRASQNKVVNDPDFLTATLEDLAGFDSVRRLSAHVAPDELDSEGQTRSSYEIQIGANTPWRATLYLKLQKEDRVAEIQTSFSSIYAPFDAKFVETDNSLR